MLTIRRRFGEDHNNFILKRQLTGAESSTNFKLRLRLRDWLMEIVAKSDGEIETGQRERERERKRVVNE